ncbi:MAG: hypothetical protein R3B93_27590 [Bacteroidia bacterium]
MKLIHANIENQILEAEDLRAALQKEVVKGIFHLKGKHWELWESPGRKVSNSLISDGAFCRSLDIISGEWYDQTITRR